MQIKIEKKDSKERLTVEVQNSNAAKVLASWLGATNFRVSAEVVFGEETPAAEPVADGPAAAASPKRAAKPAPAGEDIKAVRDHLAKHAESTPRDIVDATSLPPASVKTCLDWLVGAGQVKVEGRGRGKQATYSIVEVA